jgi:branched-subunit amino acid aminotransferase/4-amino-4-deoxychorismate lyase
MIRLIVNGQIANDAATLPFSNALLRGDGLFETILAIDQKIIAWQKHYERLASGANALEISIPAKIDLEVSMNKLISDLNGKSRIRITVLSDGNWVVSAQSEPEENLPVSLIKVNEPVISNGVLTGIKSISYGQSELAVRRAKGRGYTDGIFLNQNQKVVETGYANILILQQGKFLTPSLDSGCLPGITRQLLIQHFDISESLFTWDDLMNSDGVYLCSSVRLIKHVSKVEDKLFEPKEIGLKLIGDFNQFILSKIEL